MDAAAAATRLEIAWGVLCAAGLPDGAVRQAPKSFDRAGIRAALSDVLVRADELGPQRREPLLAFLLAMRQHWPTTFAELGDDPHQRTDGLRTGLDPNRVLKLRRIAIENLSGVL